MEIKSVFWGVNSSELLFYMKNSFLYAAEIKNNNQVEFIVDEVYNKELLGQFVEEILNSSDTKVAHLFQIEDGSALFAYCTNGTNTVQVLNSNVTAEKVKCYQEYSLALDKHANGLVIQLDTVNTESKLVLLEFQMAITKNQLQTTILHSNYTSGFES